MASVILQVLQLKTYAIFLMVMTTGYIIDLEVLDKREVELKSVNMEKGLCKTYLSESEVF